MVAIDPFMCVAGENLLMSAQSGLGRLVTNYCKLHNFPINDARGYISVPKGQRTSASQVPL